MNCGVILSAGNEHAQALLLNTPFSLHKIPLHLPWPEKALLDKPRLQPTDRHFENNLQTPFPVPALVLCSPLPRGAGRCTRHLHVRLTSMVFAGAGRLSAFGPM